MSNDISTHHRHHYRRPSDSRYPCLRATANTLLRPFSEWKHRLKRHNSTMNDDLSRSTSEQQRQQRQQQQELMFSTCSSKNTGDDLPPPPPPPTKEMRKTRFVLVSDTHNSSPMDGQYSIPDGDVLIHAGDMTNQGTLGELQKTMAWISKCKHEVKIVIAGNHDLTLDKDFYLQYWSYFHNQYPQSSDECINFMKNFDPFVIYLNHEPRDIVLTSPSGPRTKFKVFGSPHVPNTCGLWGFTYDDVVQGDSLWEAIPDDTDVLITHSPPRLHLDSVQPGSKLGGPNVGSEKLRLALGRVRPRLHVVGHVHQSRGVERIRWDGSMRHVGFRESPRPSQDGLQDEMLEWVDPGVGKNRKKLSLCDVSKGTTQFGGNGLADDETLLVNASLMVSRSSKNKPIVVDIDLPVA